MEGDRQEERDMRGRKREAGLPDEPKKIEFKGAKEQKTAGVRKTDYKRYRKQAEQSYCPDWL